MDNQEELKRLTRQVYNELTRIRDVLNEIFEKGNEKSIFDDEGEIDIEKLVAYVLTLNDAVTYMRLDSYLISYFYIFLK